MGEYRRCSTNCMHSANVLASADAVQVTMEDLQSVEAVARVDPKVIEQCVISGIPEKDMHKVYCDGMNLVVFGVRCL